jgi:hypothetical protein
MGWEKRGNGLYYYRKRRDRERVVSEYVGGGGAAYLIAQMDAIDRTERETQSKAEQYERTQIESVEVALAKLESLTRALTDAALLVNGYHTHKRQWRCKRGKD